MRWWLALALLACGGDADVAEGEGVGAYLVGLSRVEGAGAFVIEVGYGATRFELGAAPTMIDIAPDGARVVKTTPFELAPGAMGEGGERFLGWAPTRLVLQLRVGDATTEVELAPGSTMTVEVGGVRLALEGRPGAHRSTVGMTLDGALGDELAGVPGPLALKHYSGTRRWFLRAGCDDDGACAEGGANDSVRDDVRLSL